ncbi:MAG: helix-hairpin-helix domain-containing protein, partial [Gammaproteobacteria bacterium]
YRLAGRGIVTMENLADQAVDDIKDVEGLDEVKAGELIMAARAPWFASEEMQQK